MQVNVPKLKFCAIALEYLGYILTRTGIKPQRNKVQAILSITSPKQVKDLCRFLGIVQDYRDLWERCSEMLAPHTSLVGECSHTKVNRAKKNMKHAWYWNNIHQTSFDNIKASITNNVALAFPDYSKKLEFTLMP